MIKRLLLSSASLAALLAGCGGGTHYGNPSIQQDFYVALQAPDTAWSVDITGIYDTGAEVWIVAELDRDPGAMAAQVITLASDRVSIQAPHKPVRTFIIGKTWNWENDAGYTFIDSRDPIAAQLEQATRLYP